MLEYFKDAPKLQQKYAEFLVFAMFLGQSPPGKYIRDSSDCKCFLSVDIEYME